MNDQSVHPDDPQDAPSPDEHPDRAALLATWALAVALVSLAAAATCAVMVLLQGNYHLQTALYVTGMAAALAIGLGVVALLQRRLARGGVLLAALLAAAAALAAAIWSQAVTGRELALAARREFVRQVLAGIEEYAAAHDGQLPMGVRELRRFEPSGGLSATTPEGLGEADYLLPTHTTSLTIPQLAANAGDRQVILVHDGGRNGREPTVIGLLGGGVEVVSSVELRRRLDRQDDWIYRLSRRLNPPEPDSRPATGPASLPATTRATSAPSRPAEPATRISTTVPADADDR